MSTERLTLPDGQWADLSTRLTHRQSRVLNTILLAESRGRIGDPDAEDVAELFARVLTQAWRVADVSGAWLDLPSRDETGLCPDEAADRAIWDRAPGEIVSIISVRAQDIWVTWRDAVNPLVQSVRTGAGPSLSTEPGSE